MSRRLPSVLAACAALALLSAAPTAKKPAPPKAVELAVFEALLAKHKDMTYDQLSAKLAGKREYLTKLSFDPAKAKHFDRVKDELKLTDEELALFKKNGFVSIDPKLRHSFASAYYHIYARDLPVLVTSDSVLHAMHRSYDDILMELETTLFAWTIEQVLADAHGLLATRAAQNKAPAVNAKDVDLYLTVARNLLAGAAPPEKSDDPETREEWDGRLLAAAKLGAGGEALTILKGIRALKLNTPGSGEQTAIYGGKRYFDYSQFRPRGHYTKSAELKRYFRCMMWLGRADCGFHVLPTDATPGVKADSDRELRDAALMVELLRDSGGLKRLRAVDDIIAFLVGRSDNLTPFALNDLLQEAKVTSAAALDAKALAGVKKALADGKHAGQMIRSQVVVSNVNSSIKVPPPALFQVFGQRFVIDSFVLAQVVFDSILFENKKQRRMIPAGLDVMAALGNAEAVPLLKGDLTKYNYSANLMASREFVDAQPKAFWKDNLYNVWLDALRTLDDRPESKHFPEAMKTKAWEHKQLQTQLASWSELRHDTILYAKQSYTAYPDCEYPAGYVEPYPELYAKVKFFAEEAARLFEKAEYASRDRARDERLKAIKKRQVAFFKQMAKTVGTLEALAKKELKAEAFTAEEKAFLKKTVDIRGGGSGPPRYDGWYCDLYYDCGECAKWCPTVADVHTDPDSQTCLEVAVGDVNLAVIAIDNEKDRMVYVGPLFSYYEFRQPVADRLTDEKWQGMIEKGKQPARPAWVDSFQAAAKARQLPRGKQRD